MKKIVSDIMKSSSQIEVQELLMNYHKENMRIQGNGTLQPLYLVEIDEIKDWICQYNLAINCGTIYMEIAGKLIDTKTIISNLEYALHFLEMPPMDSKQSRKPIILKEMPDYLTDEELSEYFGYTMSTIQSKRCRGELPKVNGFQLTPKEELLKMLDGFTTSENKIKNQKKAINEKIASFKK